uniref:Putative ribonuclease H-like domain-containing protein n=1 Tax=Tanacetum cinerariifolium TaxID=118510 RepID=A0A6L2N1J6_TANCI|nr:putative ribonuclease H-like domain-containing protein [Tanacetum cinerariifolium]
MNYQPNHNAGIQGNFDADAAATFDVNENKNKVHVSPSSSDKPNKHDDKAKREAKGNSLVNASSVPVTAIGSNLTNSTNNFNATSPSDNVVSLNFRIGGKSSFVDPSQYPDDPYMPTLEDIIYSDDEKDIGAEADFSNLEINIFISPIPTTRVHKDHPVSQIIGELTSAPQTRSIARMGHTQEEGINYEKVFTPVAMIEAIRLFLAYASFMGFMVYQMDVKSAFLYRTIEEEVYVCRPPGFKDPDYLDKVYKVVKALYRLRQAPIAWYETLANYLLENGFQRGKIDQTLFIKKQKGDILLVQVYVDDIIFGSTNKKLCKAFKKLMKDKFQMSTMDSKSVVGLWIVNFLNAHTIQYALMVNPPIYVSCIKQFWASVSVKKTNDVVMKLQALIEKKKVVVTEDTIRQDIRLDDANGVECFPNEEISMVRNVDSPSKFLMYLRFLQVMINTQVDDLSSHNTKYTSPTLTQKVFANMRRIGKGFSGVETPLFDTMLVQPQVQDAAEVDVEDEDDNEGRIEEDVTAVKEVNAVEPTVFDDDEVTMTMTQTLIKMKAKKARLLDEQMAKRLQDEELEQVAARGNRKKRIWKELKCYNNNMIKSKKTLTRIIWLGTRYNTTRLRAEVEVSGSSSTQQDTPTVDPTEISKEDVQDMLQIIPMAEFKVEALQVKYPLIDWEIHFEGSRTYWKIIRVSGITKAYQSFKDMLKSFDREDLNALWRLVKEKFNAVMLLMLSAKLQVDEDCEMARDLVMKIFIEANKPKSRRCLPTTYKGLIEKTYTWIEAKEVTNGASNNHIEGFDRLNKGFSWDNNKGKKKNKDRFSSYKGSNHGLLANLSKSPREILAMEKAAKAFEQPPRMTATTDLFNMIVMESFMFRKRNIRMSSGTATTDLFDIKAESFKLGISSLIIKRMSSSIPPTSGITISITSELTSSESGGDASSWGQLSL